MQLLIMFWEFFKAGLFAIGGGLATLPFLYDISERYTWLDGSLLPDMVAIAESSPGPIGINVATYSGFTAAGIFGAIVTTLGIAAPSIIIITIIYDFLGKYSDSKIINRAFEGVRPASVALITSAALSITYTSVLNSALYKETGVLTDLLDPAKLIIFALLTLGVFKFQKLHPVVLIGIAAVIGIVFKL